MGMWWLLYRIIAVLIFAIGLVIWSFIEKHLEYRRRQITFNYVSWIEFPGINGVGLSLLDYIYNEQSKLNISSQYCVRAEDEENVKIVLKQFQQDISKRYFTDKLYLGKPKPVISAEDMFFVLLFSYLDEHECDYSIQEHTMHRLISRKNYGSWGGPLYDSENELTDFGLAYEKLYYVVSEYSFRNEILRKKYEIRRCEYLKKQIDDKRISISRM